MFLSSTKIGGYFESLVLGKLKHGRYMLACWLQKRLLLAKQGRKFSCGIPDFYSRSGDGKKIRALIIFQNEWNFHPIIVFKKN